MSSLAAFSIKITMALIVLSLASCGDARLPKVFGGSEVPSEVLNEPRAVPAPPPQTGPTVWPRLGDVPSKPKDFTPQLTIDAAKQEMQNDRADAERLQQDYQATPPALPSSP
jgi:hypothetical protein